MNSVKLRDDATFVTIGLDTIGALQARDKTFDVFSGRDGEFRYLATVKSKVEATQLINDVARNGNDKPVTRDSPRTKA